MMSNSSEQDGGSSPSPPQQNAAGPSGQQHGQLRPQQVAERLQRREDEEGGDGARMGDDGYPLVVDLGRSEREAAAARRRHLEHVIQQQQHMQQDEGGEDVERANMRRVFEEEAEEAREEGGPPRNAAGRQHQEQILNADGSLTRRGEVILASYQHMLNLGADEVADLGDVAEEAAAAVAERQWDQPSCSRANPANVLAIGRKPPERERTYSARTANSSSDLGWQATKTSLKERISFMYCNDVLADVYFVVGRDEGRQRIPAHKFVLSIGSVVFDAMFNGGLTPHASTANVRDPLEIELPDVEPSAFLTLLKFLYSDEVAIGPESVMTTLYTAKKYAVPAMETACVDFLKQSLGADNAFMLLTQARLFDEPQLAQLCLELIDKNTGDALAAEGFTEIDQETLCMVLRRDSLRVREVTLFEAVVRWCAEECVRRGVPASSDNRRAVLAGALQLIRFPLMTVEEFAQSAAQSGLLSDREIVNLFLYFTVNPKPQVGFDDRPRCTIAGKELVVNRFQRVEGRWGYNGTPDRIKFTVDRKIYVVGFGLHGAIHGPHEYQVTIQLIHCGTMKLLAQNETSFQCDGSMNTFRVAFREPVEVTPGVTYIASACMKGPDTHYGTKGLRRIVHQSTAGAVTFQFTYAAGNNNGTSVEDGQIPEIIFYTS